MLPSFLERATALETPKDLPAAQHQLQVLKAIIGHLEGQLHDALGRRAPVSLKEDRPTARRLLNEAYAAQRALAELNHAAQLVGGKPELGHPFPEALALASKRATAADEAFMQTFFPVPSGAVKDGGPETVAVPEALVHKLKDVVVGFTDDAESRNIYLEEHVARQVAQVVLGHKDES